MHGGGLMHGDGDLEFVQNLLFFFKNWIAFRGVGIFWIKSAHMVFWPFGLLKVLHGGAQSTHWLLVWPILHKYKFWYKLGSLDPT